MKTNFYLSTKALILILVLSQMQVGFSQEKRRVLIGFRGPNTSQSASDRANAIRGLGGELHHTFQILPVISATLPQPAINQLQKRFDIVYIEDDVELHAVTEDTPWGIARIGAPGAWGTATGSGQDVAVLDTGIDFDHPDLKANIAGGVNFAGRHPVRDGSTDSRYWNDVYGHGTHCAGTIAAIHNDDGVVGVAPNANLWAVKVLGDNGMGWTSDIVQGIEWCVQHGGIEVISMSLGGGGTTTLQEACDVAYYEKDILIVAAAGNDGGPVGYPAAYGSVMAISAVDATDLLASWSNRGPEIELAAPGVGIRSTIPDGYYGIGSGTSMACPHVAGVAALLWELGGSAATIRADLKTTAEDLGDPGWDPKYGYGLVNAYNAVGGGGTSNIPPTASFTYTPSGLTVELDASASNDTDGTIDSYSWDFGDGPTDAGVTAEHTYSTAGTYEVTLTVTDDDGAEGTTSQDVTVSAPSENQPPTADFTFTTSDLTVDFFDASSDDDSIMSWYWDFSDLGDLMDSSLQNPQHVYDAAGTYSVELIVTDNEGATDSVSKDVTVTEAGEMAMRVDDIAMSIKIAGRNVNAKATVTIFTADGVTPVAGATVYGYWEGATFDNDVGTTDTLGKVTLQSDKIKNADSETIFIFTVDNVVKSDWTYDSKANIETTDSITP